MIIEFDPATSQVVIDMEDGTPAQSFIVDRLIVTYSPGRMIAAATMERDTLELSLTPVDGPPIEVHLLATAKRRWMAFLTFSEDGTEK